jgi:hypothetical protein
MLKQNWMAASEKIRWRLRLPLAGAYHGVSLFSQIVKDPRALSAALYVAQLVVLPRVLAPLGAVMLRGYQPGESALCNKAPHSEPAPVGLANGGGEGRCAMMPMVSALTLTFKENSIP